MPTFVVDVLRLALWLLILTAVFVPLERLFAVRPQKVLRGQIATDLGHYFLNSLFVAALLAFPMAALGVALHGVVPASITGAAAALPFWPRLAASLVVGEIGFYWGHRWSHEIGFLWRFHAVHHSAEELDFLTNTRAHPVDLAFTRLCGFVPLFALGLGQTTPGPGALAPLLVVVIGTMWGFFIHANVRWRFGPLESLISTPAFHRWHHTNDERRDRNYASMLPLLDRLFGTFHVPKSWPTVYGIDSPMPRSLGGQLLAPLGLMGDAGGRRSDLGGSHGAVGDAAGRTLLP